MKLSELLLEIYKELNADGSGFLTSEAANLLYLRASQGADNIPPLVEQLARRGAREAVAEFRLDAKSLKRSAIAAAAGQMDLAELGSSFDHFLTEVAALDETESAVRKPVLRMTYPEFMRTIELCERKANQMLESVRIARAIVKQYPTWALRPHLTLGDVLGVTD
jgi:hypothetical protein